MDNPIVKQNAEEGHAVYAVTENICAEVSEFKGKIYVGIRKWFKADNGKWYRTKNGLNILLDDFKDLVTNIEDINEFILKNVKKQNGKSEDEKVPY